MHYVFLKYQSYPYDIAEACFLYHKLQTAKAQKMQLIKYAIFQNVQINDLHACLVQRPRTDSHRVTHCYLLISK